MILGLTWVLFTNLTNVTQGLLELFWHSGRGKVSSLHYFSISPIGNNSAPSYEDAAVVGLTINCPILGIQKWLNSISVKGEVGFLHRTDEIT